MDYETATDFELNKKLTELQTVKVISCDKIEVKGFGIRSIDYPLNYCNDWSGIMPIAVELGISLSLLSIIDGNERWIASRGIERSSGDPKRALVICCIKVLERK